MPRSAPPDDEQTRKDMAEDAVAHLEDAVPLAATVAEMMEDAGKDGSAWKQAHQELEALLTRVKGLAQ